MAHASLSGMKPCSSLRKGCTWHFPWPIESWEIGSAWWCLRSGHRGRVEEHWASISALPLLARGPGTMTATRKRNHGSPISVDLWGSEEMFAQKDCPRKSITQGSLISKMCQSQQEKPRCVFCLLPLLSLYMKAHSGSKWGKRLKMQKTAKRKIHKWITQLKISNC